jgi:hypothetical protein
MYPDSLSMDSINQMHGSILRLPQYSENTFEYLTEEVTFRSFVLDVIKANDNQFISRPVMEELWALLCRELVDQAFEASKDLDLKEAMLFEAYWQVNFSDCVPGWLNL